MFGISGWDWFALGIYLVGITGVGVWTARKVHNTSDFFLGGRQYGKIFMIFFAFGAGTNGNQAAGVASKTFSNGLSGIWYQWLWLFATPFYWLIAPFFRRMRAITTGDYFEYRYGGGTDALYSVVGVLQLTVTIGTMLFGASAVIRGLTDGQIPQNAAILVMTVLFVVYGVAGGLNAAIITDLIQGILTILLSFMLLPFALQVVGGFSGLHEKIADPDMFSLVAPGEINGFYIFMLVINSIVGIVTQPHIMGNCAAGRNELDGRVGFAGGNLLKRICTVAWMLTGLCALAIYLDTPEFFTIDKAAFNPDDAYGQMAGRLLPQISAGLVGLFLAALLASVMSSCDAFMVASSGLFTQNFYRRYLVHGREEGHYVNAGRVVSAFVVAGALAFAYSFDDVPSALETFWKMQAVMGAAFWVGLFWRRATAAGAWAGTIGAFALVVLMGSTGFNDWASGTRAIHEDMSVLEFSEYHGVNLTALRDVNAVDVEEPPAPGTRLRITEPAVPEIMLWEGEIKFSWQILIYLTAGFALCILVSLVTPRPHGEKLERVYACLRTPVQPNEPNVSTPFTLPEGITAPPPKKLINHPDLEIPFPSMQGMVGFAVLWVCVGALVGSVYWMATWGT
ncbi:MAG: sodium:solute symporter [Candidatus Hydrogenedentota bacterium]